MFTKNLLLSTFSILILSYSFTSCSSLQKTIKVNPEHNYSKEYYESLGNNINRLIEMRTGVFVQHLLSDGKQELWKINDGQDSTIIIARKVGIPSRDGHWILTYTFMTHAHDDPLSVTLEKYVPSPTSRDTIYCHFYNAPESVTWEQISDKDYVFNELNFKEKTEYRNQYITLAKQNLMEYTGPTNFIEASFFKEKYDLRKDIYAISPQDSKFEVFFSKTETSEPYVYPSIQVLVKLPLVNNFYPNGTIYISDKKEK
jgi:hypothetical protein